MTLKRVCAWCQADLGILECPESGVTHGICRNCRTQVVSQHWLQAQHLRAGLALDIEDHILWLKQSDMILASFTLPVNRNSLLQEADKYLHLQPAEPDRIPQLLKQGQRV